MAGALSMMIVTACSQKGAVDQDVAAAFRSQARSMYLAFDAPCISWSYDIDTATSELLARIKIEKFEMRAHQSALAQDLITAKADAYFEKGQMRYECLDPENDKALKAAVITENRTVDTRLEALDATLPRMRPERYHS